MKTIWFLAGALALGAPILAQHHEAPAEVKTPEQHSEFKHWRIAPLIGHTMVPAGTSSDHFAIPSWGLDLEYWLNPKWGIGLHNDLEVQSFIVEHDGQEMLERESPLVLSLDLLWKPWKGLVFLAGPGYEFEKEENFKLLRFGAEYEFEFDHHWDISPSLFYDTRQEAYDTWSIALGIGKRF